jgi:lipopolysaccharide transport system ATP-binding protein
MMQRPGPAAEPLVVCERVSKRFTVHLDAQRSFQERFIELFQRSETHTSEFWSLQDVSFTVNRGDCVGVIGPNGSGKSTLLKLISRILDPTTGRISTRGRVASLLELGSGFHPELTGRENVYLNASVYGMSRKEVGERLDDIIAFAELGEFIDVPIKHYSSGMYVRLGFAVAIHTDPDLLLVDEVLAVGDAAFQIKCMKSIAAFRARGGTLLLVTHDLGAVQALCNRAMWLDHGKVAAMGQPTDVVMAYLNHLAQKAREMAQEPEGVPAVEGVRRWGTGRIEITQVRLCDSGGAPCAIFVNGAAMEIRIDYRVRGRVEDPIFGLGIHHENGTLISGPNTGFGRLHIPFVEDAGQIRYRIPALPLLEGRYLVSVSSHNRADTEMYDYHDRAYAFEVYPGASSERYGLVTLSGNWIPDEQQGEVLRPEAQAQWTL